MVSFHFARFSLTLPLETKRETDEPSDYHRRSARQQSSPSRANAPVLPFHFLGSTHSQHTRPSNDADPSIQYHRGSFLVLKTDGKQGVPDLWRVQDLRSTKLRVIDTTRYIDNQLALPITSAQRASIALDTCNTVIKTTSCTHWKLCNLELIMISNNTHE